MVVKTGRLSGSTIVSMLERKDNIKTMNLEVVTTVNRMQDGDREQGIKMLHGKIGQVIPGIKESYNLEDVEINIKIVHSKIQRDKLETSKFSPNGPIYNYMSLFLQKFTF